MTDLENLPEGEHSETTTFTQEQVDAMISEKLSEVKDEFEEKLNKIQNKIGYEQRKTKETTVDTDSIVNEALAKLRDEQAEKDILNKYPNADVQSLKELKSKHPTLSWDEVVSLSWNVQSYWLDGEPNRSTWKKVYTNEDFAKLSVEEQGRVIQEAKQGKVQLKY